MRETGIRGISVNSRIINVFRKKIGTLYAELKKAKKKSGGFGVKKLTDKSRDQTYDVNIYYHKLDNHVIEQENQDLRGDKQKLEESLEKEINKRQKLEKKLEDTESRCKYLRNLKV